MSLKAKQVYDNADVARVFATIEQHVTEGEAQTAVAAAVYETRQVLGSRTDAAVYGWSGGKDSQALRVIMQGAGVNRAVLGIIPHLEWHAYLSWIDANAPENLETYANTDLTLEWLGRPQNSRYLFPRTSTDGYFWTRAGTRRAQFLYQDRHQPDVQIYGRRSKDGNAIGRDRYGIARSGKLTVYCPMRTWSHELTLAVVHYFRMPLPPVYDWLHGWTAGTGTWPGRRVGTYEQSWAETYAIEPDRVREAAQYVSAARHWLERNAP